MKKAVHTFALPFAIIVFAIACMALPGKTMAQVIVHPHQTALQLAQDLVDSAIVIDNPVLTCDSMANGVFTDTGATNPLGLTGGIVLTTGTAASDGFNVGINGVAGDFANTALNIPGDSQLTAVIGAPTNDACILEFDVTPTWDTLLFNYSFGSEEYPEFNCTGFNDVFAFFITGPGFDSATNIALVPGTNIPVAINSINDSSNITASCTIMGPGTPFGQYYIDNSAGTALTYDGFTQILTAKAAVVSGSTYHLKLAIADATDGVYDSGVLLAGGSLYSKPGHHSLALQNAAAAGMMRLNPNPFKKEITANVADGLLNTNVLVTVTNVSGQQVLSYNGKGAGLNSSLKASAEWPAGMYVVTLMIPATNYREVTRVLKQD